MKNFIYLLLVFLFAYNISDAQDVVLKKGKYILRSTGKNFTGVFKEYDPEKSTLISETTIKNGILDGETKIYFASGGIKELRNYADGKKHGIWSTFNDKGVKTAEASFKEGKKDGFWYIWDDQGQKRYEMFYVNGEKKGKWIIMDEKGQIISSEEFN